MSVPGYPANLIGERLVGMLLRKVMGNIRTRAVNPMSYDARTWTFVKALQALRLGEWRINETARTIWEVIRKYS